MRTFPAAETVAEFRTSGTTGEGYGSHYFRSLRLYEASILAAWDALGILRLRQAILTQRPADAPHSSLCHMMGTLAARAPGKTDRMDRRPRLGAWTPRGSSILPCSGARLRERARWANRCWCWGRRWRFLHLFERLGRERIVLPPGSLAMETGGYKGTGRSLTKGSFTAASTTRLDLESGSILNEYSMTELSSQWYTRGLGRPHTGPAWTRALT